MGACKSPGVNLASILLCCKIVFLKLSAGDVTLVNRALGEKMTDFSEGLL